MAPKARGGEGGGGGVPMFLKTFCNILRSWNLQITFFDKLVPNSTNNFRHPAWTHCSMNISSRKVIFDNLCSADIVFCWLFSDIGCYKI